MSSNMCAEIGHDWYIKSGVFYDKATCMTCGRTVRDMILYYSELPNRRKDN